jgi:hypothetical protein
LNVSKARYREEDMLRILKAENERDIEQKLLRQRELQIQHKQEQRFGSYQKCQQIVLQLIKLAETADSHL